jgi:hypothetical protein
MLKLVDLISFAEAAAVFPRRRCDRPLHVGTLHRWRTKGIRGICLPARRVGGIWMTSAAALDWFVEQLTRASESGKEPGVNSDIATDDSRLKSAGW